MDEKSIYRKLRRKPKPVPLSNIKRSKITIVHNGSSLGQCNTTVADTAENSRYDKLKDNDCTNPTSPNNDLPENTTVKTCDNALLCRANEKIVNSTCLNQDEQISTCNKMGNVQVNLISNSAASEQFITTKLGDKLLPISNILIQPKNCIAERIIEACTSSSVNSKLIDCNTDKLFNKNLSENVINTSVSSKKGVADKSIKLIKEATKEDHCIQFRVAEKNCKLLKESSKLMPLAKPFSRINKSDLKKIRASAYDEDGNLNFKKLMLRDFIYFNPPHNPMVGNDRQSNDESDVSYYIKSNCDEETQAPVAAPQLKVNSRGKIVLDRKSLTIPSSTDKELRNLKKSTVVPENKMSDCYEIKNWKRKEKQHLNELVLKGQQIFSKFWTPAETLKFYKVIDDFGLDFSLMIEEFPYRTRKQLKRKYLYEDKVRRRYVDAAMKKRDSVDFEALEKELTKKQFQREKKEKEKELIIRKKKEDSHQVRHDLKNSSNKAKVPTVINYIGPDGKGYRSISESTLKIKRMKAYIRELKSKYLEETGKNKNSPKDFCKYEKKSVNSNEFLMFDLSIPLYKELFNEKEDVKFIDLIKSVDDFNLFNRVALEMFQNLGKDWRYWVKERVANEILNKKTDSEDEDLRSVALEVKSSIEQQKTNEKLESCYQLFSDPFDYVDPMESDKI